MRARTRAVFVWRRIGVAAAAAGVLAAGTYLPVTLLAPLSPIEPVPVAAASLPAAPPTLPFPAFGASGLGAVGFDGVLAASGPTTALPIASLTKVVTALVVLDARPLAADEAGPALALDATDVGFYRSQLADGGSVVAVTDGLVLSERAVLSTMLLASANNLADSIARWAFGDADGYRAAVAAWIAGHGLRSTTIVEPSGVSPANTSTVADLVELARTAVADPVIRQMVATASLEVEGLGRIDNRNTLLGIDGIDGIKTGTLDEAGSCLLFSQTLQVGSETVTVLGVVLGGPDHDTVDAVVRGLLAQADSGFAPVTLATAGEPFAEYSSVWGDSAHAVAAQTVTTVRWSGTEVTERSTADPIRLADVGSEVGSVEFTVGSTTLSVPLVLDATIDDPGPGWRIVNPGKLP